MKTIKTIICLLFVIATAANGQDQKISEIGQFISSEIALDYMANFQKDHPNQVHGLTYGREMLQDILTTANAEGIVIYMAENSKGQFNFVLQAVNENSRAFGAYFDTGSTCPPNCNGSEWDRESSSGLEIAKIGHVISDSEAEEMLSNNKMKITFNLYGRQILEDLLAIEGTAGVYFANGLNESGDYHLVLASIDKNGQIIEGSYANTGSTCPPDCDIFGDDIGITKKN